MNKDRILTHQVTQAFKEQELAKQTEQAMEEAEFDIKLKIQAAEEAAE